MGRKARRSRESGPQLWGKAGLAFIVLVLVRSDSEAPERREDDYEHGQEHEHEKSPTQFPIAGGQTPLPRPP